MFVHPVIIVRASQDITGNLVKLILVMEYYSMVRLFVEEREVVYLQTIAPVLVDMEDLIVKAMVVLGFPVG